MRIFTGILAFLCLFGAVALYDTSPHLIQNSDWISPGIVRLAAYLMGIVGVLLVLTVALPRGKGAKRKAKAKA